LLAEGTKEFVRSTTDDELRGEGRNKHRIRLALENGRQMILVSLPRTSAVCGDCLFARRSWTKPA
jgi:urease accessory protein UreE